MPDPTVQFIQLLEGRIEAQLVKELALDLHVQELLFFCKARELVNLDHG